jgi:hypothetical protein
MSDKAKEDRDRPEAKPHGKTKSDPLLKIVRSKDPKKAGEELDLELGEFEGDRRYGREDIADK